jgi:hypothetical protein
MATPLLTYLSPLDLAARSRPQLMREGCFPGVSGPGY